MNKGKIHFADTQAASEYRSAMDRQGYDTRQGVDRKGTYVQITGDRNPRQNVDSGLAEQLKDKEQRLEAIGEMSGRTNTARKILGGMKRELQNIASGMTEPNSFHRMKIARMPGTRREIPIVSTRVISRLAPKNVGLKSGRIALIPKGKQ